MNVLDAIEGYLVLGLVLALIGGFAVHAITDGRRTKHQAPTQLNLTGLNARTNVRLVRTLLLLAVLGHAGQSLAADRHATIPYPEPRLSEATLLPLTSPAVSRAGFRDESLACDHAHTRAMNGLREQIHRARTRGHIDPHLLISFDSLQATRSWSPAHGRCTVTLSLMVSDANWKPVRQISSHKRF